MGYQTFYRITNASELFSASGEHCRKPLSYSKKVTVERTIKDLENMKIPVPQELRQSLEAFEPKSIVERIFQNEEAMYCLGSCLDGENNGKWYEHEDFFKKITKEYPGVLVELYGEGEEAGDIWIKYFKDGKMQLCEAQIVFDSFDESKLK